MDPLQNLKIGAEEPVPRNGHNTKKQSALKYQKEKCCHFFRDFWEKNHLRRKMVKNGINKNLQKQHFFRTPMEKRRKNGAFAFSMQFSYCKIFWEVV